MHLKIFNFDASEVIDPSVSEKEMEYGINMKDYPWFNDIYASKHVLDFIEAHTKERSQPSEPESLKVYTLNITGSRNGMRYVKKINPFKEDVFSFGMTLLQLTKLTG